MRNLRRASVAALFIAQAIGAAEAQLPKLPGVNSPGLNSIAGGLPNISSISAGNAAGLLGYCLKNNVLSGAGAQSVASGLLKKPGLSASPDYAAGQAGRILSGHAKPVSLGQLPAQMKSKACKMVLQRG